MTTNLELNSPYSACELKRVRSIDFGIFEPEFLKRMSVCEVTSTELYKDGLPNSCGLNDLRMGTTDHRINCSTCNMDVKHCPGHFGHITLAKPMYHYGFITTVMKVLRSVCYNCGRLLISPSDPRALALGNRSGSKRLHRMAELCVTRSKCETDIKDHSANKSDGDVLLDTVFTNGVNQSMNGTNDQNGYRKDDITMGCGYPQPKYYKEGPNLMIQFNDKQKELLGDSEDYIEGKRALSAEEALEIMKRISEEDMKALGFNPIRSRPSWLILTVLPVPPPSVRPYVQFGSDRSEDDLTLKLMDILKTNNQLKKQDERGVATHIIQEMCQLLQFHITTLFDNEIPGMPVASTRSKKPIKAIRSRLKGKEGRLRGNLMGKRVDFSARTVITGDPNIPIDTIGVPKSIAMTLTFPETVTPLNYAILKKKVEKGPHEWPGAKYIVRDDGTRYDLRHVRRPAELQLEYGYKVERHMQDGDYILFNRQPSLHKMSIMGHKAKILPYSTFRLNLSVTSPYNADFDGDEMNLHLAQTHEARSEIKHLMLSPKQIVSPQGNKPVMGIVQDSLLGVSKFTKKDTFLTRDVLMNLLTWIPYWDGRVPLPCIFYPQRLWTGKQVISILLSFDQAHLQHQININMTRSSGFVSTGQSSTKILDQYDNEVIIRQNEHLTGTICKRTVGSSSGSLIHVLWHEAGPERTKDFITTLQKVVNNWLIDIGFTVSCSDILTSDTTLDRVSDSLMAAKDRVQQLVSLAQRGRLECQPGKSLFESFEARVNKELNEAREQSGKIVAGSLDERNNILAMVFAGSKGSSINISQIIACVGQQNVEGKRIPFGFCDRSLPHFIKHDYGPESRGFVSNSYLSGLTPQEMFFHAMGGREGIIDTACKTSETGYIQRRLIKAMEDIMVHYDGTVRNSGGDILQFLYGEDGMNAEFVEDQSLELLELDNQQLQALFYHDFKDSDYGRWILDDEIREAILTDYTRQMVLMDEFKHLIEMKTLLCREVFSDGASRQHLPINIKRLVEYAKTQFPRTVEARRPLCPVYIAQSVKKLLQERLIVIHRAGSADYLSEEAQDNATLLMRAHLIPALNSRRLMEREQIGLAAFEWLLGEVERHFNIALVHAGECVGAIAAQSIGEPATQMTLNTFHFAGVGSKNVTLGVPRLKELINVVTNVKTPSLTVYLEDSVARDQERAKDVQLQLEHTTLGHVVSFAQVIYDPIITETIVTQDKQWVSDYYEFPDDETALVGLGSWLLRVQLSNRAMTDKKLTMREIGECIYREFSSEELDVIWTDDNSEELVIRIRLRVGTQGGPSEDVFLQKLMSQYLCNVTLRGVSNITKVYMREEAVTAYNETRGQFERRNNWVLDTDGCNLEKVLSIPQINFAKTISNDITEIFNVLGIEAARRALLRELRTVISFDGSYVNYRHLALLCDVMTHKGHLMSITRHGINRVDRGPLIKCSFEETLEILLDAATFAISDGLSGVTENVMMGQLCPLGTGCFDVLIDAERLRDANQNFQTATLDYSDLSSNVNSQTMSEGQFSPGHASPDQFASPSQAALLLSPVLLTEAPDYNGVDTRALGGTFSPVCQSPTSPTSPMSPFSPRVLSPSSPLSPILSPRIQSPNVQSPVLSPNVLSPNILSPNVLSPNIKSPNRAYSPSSPVFEATSVYTPAFSPSSPSLFAGSGVYSPSSPSYQPTGMAQPLSVTSPEYSPTSPQMYMASPGGGYSPSFSTTSPKFSPTSPGIASPLGDSDVLGIASPSSPSYPMSLVYDIVSPAPLSPEQQQPESSDPFDLDH